MDGRILLVEDDASIREITALGLRGAGFEVTTAVDGVEGLAKARSEQPDLVLLDVMLPRMDGLEVCREIRRDSTVPVVMLTARGDTIDVVVGLESGADDYVTKPFEMAVLIARVRAALRRRAREPTPAESDVLRLGPLRIDVPARTVDRDGTAIPLTRTEFDVLVELAGGPARCSRASSSLTACGATTSSATRAWWTWRSGGCAPRSSATPPTRSSS